MEIVRLSPNRWPRALTRPRYFVLHTTQGTNSLGWLTNPNSMVSATWLVPQHGPNWYRLGELNDAMWHAGIVSNPATPYYYGTNPNLVSWGIEFEGFASEPLTQFQLEVARTLLGTRPDLPLVPHAALATSGPFFRSDPGITNLAAILLAVKGETMSYAEIEENVKGTIRLMLTSPEGAMLVEHAIRHQIGYGNKLQTYLDASYAKKAGASGPVTGSESPFGPVEDKSATGQRGDWPADLGPEPKAPGRP
jgi:hypothetical protein